jgi:hypothetical protein
VVEAERRLGNRQGPLLQRQRLRVTPQIAVGSREVAQDGRELGDVITVDALSDVQGGDAQPEGILE